MTLFEQHHRKKTCDEDEKQQLDSRILRTSPGERYLKLGCHGSKTLLHFVICAMTGLVHVQSGSSAYMFLLLSFLFKLGPFMAVGVWPILRMHSLVFFVRCKNQFPLNPTA